MAKRQYNPRIESALRDLLFELSEADQSKFCIAICDDVDLREQLKTSIQEQLTDQGTATLVIEPSAKNTDLTDLIRHRIDHANKHVVIIDRLEELPEDSLNLFLSYLNFKRDILSAQRIPILILASNWMLNQLVARAPDFWSRRTVTHFFTPASVAELVSKLFAREETTREGVRSQGKVFQALRKVFSHERELEQIIQHSIDIPILELDRLTSGIQAGVNDLIRECYSSNRFEVAFRLWVLAGTDLWLKRLARNIRVHFDSTFRDLYEDRMDIMVKIADKIVPILENYQNNLVQRVEERRKVNLLGYFNSYLEGEARRMFTEIRVDNFRHDRLLPEEIQELAGKDDRLQTSLLDDIREKAAANLIEWIQRRATTLPRIFSDEDGKILRLLYQGKREPSTIAEKLGITIEDAKKKVETVRSKVSLFIAMDL